MRGEELRWWEETKGEWEGLREQAEGYIEKRVVSTVHC